MSKILKDGASYDSIQTYLTIINEINYVYGKISFQRYKNETFISLATIEKWRDQVDSILPDIKDTQLFADKYATMINKIQKQLEDDKPQLLAIENFNQLKKLTNYIMNSDWVTSLLKNILILLFVTFIAWICYKKMTIKTQF